MFFLFFLAGDDLLDDLVDLLHHFGEGLVGLLHLGDKLVMVEHMLGFLQRLTEGRLDASILRQLLIALAMIVIMLLRPRGL